MPCSEAGCFYRRALYGQGRLAADPVVQRRPARGEAHCGGECRTATMNIAQESPDATAESAHASGGGGHSRRRQ